MEEETKYSNTKECSGIKIKKQMHPGCMEMGTDLTVDPEDCFSECTGRNAAHESCKYKNHLQLNPFIYVFEKLAERDPIYGHQSPNAQNDQRRTGIWFSRRGYRLPSV